MASPIFMENSGRMLGSRHVACTCNTQGEIVSNPSDYLLGNTDREHERLIRQAARLLPITESFFREVGITCGQRILDVGSGVGDVAILLARLVGAGGKVVGIDRDPKSIRRATARVIEANLKNVEFVESDIAQCDIEGPFDAIVGRYVLQFLPEPAATLRHLMRHLRTGGTVAFLEGSWEPFVLLSRHLPLWSTGVRLLQEVSTHFGVNLEMGLDLHRVFLDAGLPAPKMRLEMELGHDPDFTRWVSDTVASLQTQFHKFQISIEPLGDLDTLQERLHAEVAASRTVAPWIALVGAYSRRQ